MSDIFGSEEEPTLPQDTPEPTPEPVVEPEPTPEPVEAEEKPAVPQVPIHALHEARAELAKLKEENQKFQGMYEEVQEWRQSQKASQDQEKFNTDPLGALKEDIQSLKSMQEQRDQKEQQAQQSNEQQEQVIAQVQGHVAEFTKTTPDYQDALTHVLESRAQELRMMGTPEGQVQQVIQQESLGLAQNALASGGNPAEVVYNLAKLRGYSPKASQSDKIEQIEKGQQAASTLPSGTEEAVSLTNIESMSDEEFDAFWEKEMDPKRH